MSLISQIRMQRLADSQKSKRAKKEANRRKWFHKLIQRKNIPVYEICAYGHTQEVATVIRVGNETLFRSNGCSGCKSNGNVPQCALLHSFLFSPQTTIARGDSVTLPDVKEFPLL